MGRVLFTGIYPGLYGGLERFAERAAELLRRRGHTVDVVADPPEELGDYDFVLMQKIPRTVGDLRRLKAKYGEKLFFYAHDHELYCLRRHYYTPTRCNCDRMYSPIPCRLCAAVTRPQWVWRALTRPMRDFQREMADLRAFVPATYIKRNLVRAGLKPENVTVLPPLFLDTEAPEFGIKRTGWMPADRLRILFMGQLIAGKGCGMLLDAVSRMKAPHTLTVVGTGRDEPKLRASAGSDVVFTGWQENAQRFFADADVCAVPSLWNEPYGTVGAEALAHGVPVVTFDVGGLRDWLRPGETGFFASAKTPQALAETLDRCADRELLAKMSEGAYAVTRERHSVKVFIETLERTGGIA